MTPLPRRDILARRDERLLTAPSFGWLLVFFAVPALIIFVISFREADLSGGMGGSWTLRNWLVWTRADVLDLTARTLWMAALTTLFCLALAIPAAWFMARCTPFWRGALLLLVIIPFWTNSLIRTFAWKALLGDGSPLHRLASALGLLEPGGALLYNQGAVLLVLVYTHLPFAILPLYAAAEKFDFALLDAARDLGASALRAFCAVFIPGIATGLAAAALLVFVPALGNYLVPDLVGGHSSELIGNRIAQRAFNDRNLPEASALASGLALMVLVVAVAGRAFFSPTPRPETPERS